MADRAQVERLTKELIADGLLIEAGFLSLCLATLPQDVSELQLREMRMAFFAGAQHTFGSIMSMLDDGAEPTAADLKRMDDLAALLKKFGVQFLEDLPTKGRV